MGADYETPHEFKSGDTISAEMMNELFENIKLSKTVILSSDLVGTWSCKVSVSYSNTHDPGWTDDSDNLSSKLTSELTFSADGDGTYTLTVTGRATDTSDVNYVQFKFANENIYKNIFFNFILF